MAGSQPLLGQVTGWVKEKETNDNCPGASVFLLRVDSTLLKQTQCEKGGSFFLSGRLSSGRYILLVLYPGREALYRKLVLTDTLPLDVGVLYLMPKSDSLQAVIVRPSAVRPRFKGDTVEYNTGSIKLRINATVEELLGRLPGLQIDADGNIIYNGEKVNKLLVDGEDFFGSNPTIVTRNFDASRIDKVQILDRKSDHTTFTGIDDGTRTKTLNLVMKQDSRNGYFGKVEGEANPQGTYRADGLLAAFERHEQIAAIGFVSNTGSLGFSADLGGSTAGISSNNNTSDPLGATAGKGIPRFLGTALHYANTWNGSSDHLVGNYQYSSFFSQPVTTSVSLQTLPDSIYGQYRQSHSTNQQQQHWGYLTHDDAVDSLSAIKIVTFGSVTTAQNQYGDTALSTFNGINVNNSLRTINDKENRLNLHIDANYRLRARHHPGRVFTISTAWSGTNSTTNGYLYSIDRFYRPDASLESRDTTDQRKLIENKSINMAGELSYAEPLWSKATLALTYNVNYTSNNALQGSYGRGGGKYDVYLDSLSSRLQEQNVNQQTSVNLQGGDSRLSYTFGTGIQRYSYNLQDLQVDSMSRYRYWNFTPRFLISYTPNPVTHVSFAYSGTPQQPSITQLQPIVNNSNPLLVILGNPGLRPGFNQTWGLNFNRLKSWMYNLRLDFGVMGNSISTKTTTNILGQQTSQPVNVNGGKKAGANFSIHKRLLGLDFGMNAGENYTRAVNYLNTTLNRTDSYMETGGISVSYYSVDKYSFQLNTAFSYFDTHSSVDLAAPVHYWTQSHSGNLSLFFIRNFEVHTDAAYTWQQSTSAFNGSTSVLLWNASILRNFLHGRLSAKFQANNLLNANAGISRTSSANLNTESTTNILGRYWLLSLTYHFDHQWKRR